MQGRSATVKSAILGMHGNGRVVYKVACVEVKISGLSVLLINTHGGAPPLLQREVFTVLCLDRSKM